MFKIRSLLHFSRHNFGSKTNNIRSNNMHFNNTHKTFISSLNKSDETVDKKTNNTNNKTNTTNTNNKTNSDEINSDIGLTKFINKTYQYTGGGILSTLGMGFLFHQTPQLMQFGSEFAIGGMIIGLMGCLGMSLAKYNIKSNKVRVQNKDITCLHSENSLGRQLSFGSVVLGMSMMTGPVFAIIDAQEILLPSLLSTSLIFVSKNPNKRLNPIYNSPT